MIRSVVKSKMTPLLSKTHSCVLADRGTIGVTNLPAEIYEGTNDDMDGRCDSLGIQGPPAVVGDRKGTFRNVGGVWEMDPIVSCGEDPGDEDGGVDYVSPGIAGGSIMHGG